MGVTSCWYYYGVNVEEIPEYIDDVVRAGPLVVSAEAASQCWLDGRALSLTVRQVRMLAMLVRARGALVARHELYRCSTGRDLPPQSRAVDMDLWRIRKELGPYGNTIRSVRKVGYACDVRLLENHRGTDP